MSQIYSSRWYSCVKGEKKKRRKKKRKKEKKKERGKERKKKKKDLNNKEIQILNLTKIRRKRKEKKKRETKNNNWSCCNLFDTSDDEAWDTMFKKCLYQLVPQTCDVQMSRQGLCNKYCNNCSTFFSSFLFKLTQKYSFLFDYRRSHGHKMIKPIFIISC